MKEGEFQMKNLLIAGAGGFGREVYDMILETFSPTEFRVKGFLSDVPTALDNYPELPARIVGTIVDYEPEPDDRIFVAIGDVAGRKKVAEILAAKGAQFLNLIHPTVISSQFVEIGAGVIICRGVLIGPNTKIGDFSLINCCATIGHDSALGKFSVICPHVSIGGFAKIGAECFIGANASVSPKVSLGKNSTVCANSFVARDTRDEAFIIGVPGKEF